jgi:hypothetical protein
MSIRSNQVHLNFSKRLGSKNIASLKALQVILRYSMYLNRNNSNSFVLEIGSGIGTIAHLVLKNTNLHYLAYETNDFCIKQLKQNVNSEKLTCINSFNDLLQNESLGEVSFLIIDDLIDKKRLKLLLCKIKPKYIFIEGHRFSTRKDLVSIISEKYANKYFLIKYFIFSYHSNKGGMLVRFFYESNYIASIIQKLITVYSLQRFKLVNNYIVYRIIRFCGNKTAIFIRSIPKFY